MSSFLVVGLQPHPDGVQFKPERIGITSSSTPDMIREAVRSALGCSEAPPLFLELHVEPVTAQPFLVVVAYGDVYGQLQQQQSDLARRQEEDDLLSVQPQPLATLQLYVKLPRSNPPASAGTDTGTSACTAAAAAAAGGASTGAAARASSSSSNQGKAAAGTSGGTQEWHTTSQRGCMFLVQRELDPATGFVNYLTPAQVPNVPEGLAAGMSAQEKAVKEQAMRDIKNKCIDAVVAFTLHMHAHSRDKSGKVELSSSKVREYIRGYMFDINSRNPKRKKPCDLEKEFTAAWTDYHKNVNMDNDRVKWCKQLYESMVNGEMLPCILQIKELPKLSSSHAVNSHALAGSQVQQQHGTNKAMGWLLAAYKAGATSAGGTTPFGPQNLLGGAFTLQTPADPLSQRGNTPAGAGGGSSRTPEMPAGATEPRGGDDQPEGTQDTSRFLRAPAPRGGANGRGRGGGGGGEHSSGVGSQQGGRGRGRERGGGGGRGRGRSQQQHAEGVNGLRESLLGGSSDDESSEEGGSQQDTTQLHRLASATAAELGGGRVEGERRQRKRPRAEQAYYNADDIVMDDGDQDRVNEVTHRSGAAAAAAAARRRW